MNRATSDFAERAAKDGFPDGVDAKAIRAGRMEKFEDQRSDMLRDNRVKLTDYGCRFVGDGKRFR
jgi:hypothetical protein